MTVNSKYLPQCYFFLALAGNVPANLRYSDQPEGDAALGGAGKTKGIPGSRSLPRTTIATARTRNAAPAGSRQLADRFNCIDWRDLELFLAVAEAGSVRAGAAATRHSIATIRRRLARIEDKLGERLADRDPQGLRLTPAGERVMTIAREMRRLRQNLEAGDDEPGLRRHVRIAVTEGLGTYWLMPRLVEFQRAHPELNIMLHCDMQRSDVAGGACDIAIQLERPDETSLILERLGFLHLMPFASDGYLREMGTPLSIDEWPRHRLVWQEADQVASNLLPYVLGSSDALGSIALRTNSSSAHFRAIAGGGGIGILPTYARAVSRRVRPIEVGLHLRREIYCAVNAKCAGDTAVNLALVWLRESFDGSRFPWFADVFIHPNSFEAAISSPNVISLFEGFIDTLDADDTWS